MVTHTCTLFPAEPQVDASSKYPPRATCHRLSARCRVNFPLHLKRLAWTSTRLAKDTANARLCFPTCVSRSAAFPSTPNFALKSRTRVAWHPTPSPCAHYLSLSLLLSLLKPHSLSPLDSSYVDEPRPTRASRVPPPPRTPHHPQTQNHPHQIQPRRHQLH